MREAKCPGKGEKAFSATPPSACFGMVMQMLEWEVAFIRDMPHCVV